MNVRKAGLTINTVPRSALAYDEAISISFRRLPGPASCSNTLSSKTIIQMPSSPSRTADNSTNAISIIQFKREIDSDPNIPCFPEQREEDLDTIDFLRDILDEYYSISREEEEEEY